MVEHLTFNQGVRSSNLRWVTILQLYIIYYILYMERYRSGHNEAVLKTVCPQGRVGSNPTLSVIIARSHIDTVQFFSGKCSRENERTNTILCVRSAWRSTQEAEGAPLERE